MPMDIVRLPYLAYLGLYKCERLTHLPLGIKNLSFLKELSVFIVTESANSRAARLGELQHLNNRSRSLSIRGLEWVKDESEGEAASLKEKRHL
ncbi:unnamed protein product [Linum trigynum]|uniref:Uncharacterized protein n=1 Tax=Linum trigynum TaxID=586398 RepID=A0AAV2DSG2_9ROSI